MPTHVSRLTEQQEQQSLASNISFLIFFFWKRTLYSWLSIIQLHHVQFPSMYERILDMFVFNLLNHGNKIFKGWDPLQLKNSFTGSWSFSTVLFMCFLLLFFGHSAFGYMLELSIQSNLVNLFVFQKKPCKFSAYKVKEWQPDS